jgi:hypothetical protein
MSNKIDVEIWISGVTNITYPKIWLDMEAWVVVFGQFWKGVLRESNTGFTNTELLRACLEDELRNLRSVKSAKSMPRRGQAVMTEKGGSFTY